MEYLLNQSEEMFPLLRLKLSIGFHQQAKRSEIVKSKKFQRRNAWYPCHLYSMLDNKYPNHLSLQRQSLVLTLAFLHSEEAGQSDPVECRQYCLIRMEMDSYPQSLTKFSHLMKQKSVVVHLPYRGLLDVLAGLLTEES